MIVGKELRPNSGIASDFAKPIVDEVGLMCRDVKRELIAVFKATGFDSAMDASTTSQARIILNALMTKWQSRFNKIAKRAVDRNRLKRMIRALVWTAQANTLNKDVVVKLKKPIGRETRGRLRKKEKEILRSQISGLI
jgi:ribonuclease P protein component